MKIVKIEFEGGTAAGIVEGDVVRLIGVGSPKPAVTASFTSTPDELEHMARSCGRTLARRDVRLAAPCDPLRKILCVCMNYRDHTSEIAVEALANPSCQRRRRRPAGQSGDRRALGNALSSGSVRLNVAADQDQNPRTRLTVRKLQRGHRRTLRAWTLDLRRRRPRDRTHEHCHLSFSSRLFTGDHERPGRDGRGV